VTSVLRTMRLAAYTRPCSGSLLNVSTSVFSRTPGIARSGRSPL
jgi:hypothetical protein